MNKSHNKRKSTNEKCENFCNGNCSFNCPNATLEGACNYWDLDPSDFGLEYIQCHECQYNDDECTCDDCYFMGNEEYCPKLGKRN